MSKRIPKIATVMTPFPYSVAVESDLGTARGVMEEHSIQHLPVMEGDKLVGLLWQRDIRVARGLRPYIAANEVTVGSVCNREPLVVDIAERLDIVVLKMAERRLGAAIVTREGRLAGILTTTDVCRLLGEALRVASDIPSGDDDVA